MARCFVGACAYVSHYEGFVNLDLSVARSSETICARVFRRFDYLHDERRFLRGDSANLPPVLLER